LTPAHTPNQRFVTLTNDAGSQGSRNDVSSGDSAPLDVEVVSGEPYVFIDCGESGEYAKRGETPEVARPRR